MRVGLRAAVIMFGFPERYEIAEYDRAGSLARLIRRAWSPTAVPQTIYDEDDVPSVRVYRLIKP